MSEDRAKIIRWVGEAQDSGARQSKACEIIGISEKTLQRWKQPGNDKDGRIDAKYVPANKLSDL